jgi:hypothetical protein
MQSSSFTQFEVPENNLFTFASGCFLFERASRLVSESLVDISAILYITSTNLLVPSTYTPSEKNFQAHNALTFTQQHYLLLVSTT